MVLIDGSEPIVQKEDPNGKDWTRRTLCVLGVMNDEHDYHAVEDGGSILYTTVCTVSEGCIANYETAHLAKSRGPWRKQKPLA